MATDDSSEKRVVEGEGLRDTLFVLCKRWLIAGYCLKAATFLSGVITIVFSFSYWLAPIGVAVLAAIAELALWRSDQWKGDAESMHRKLDFEDSFGWPISANELRDLRVRVKKESPLPRTANYFASKEVPSATRALHNLEESSFWSKHQATAMAKLLLALIGLLILGCIVFLMRSVATVPNQLVAESIIRVVTSSLLLLFSFGLLRLWHGYQSFANKAERIERTVLNLKGSGKTLDTQEVMKLWNDYHLARAGAPVLPTWLWKLKEKHLNRLWKEAN
jgi:hypothetical protein